MNYLVDVGIIAATILLIYVGVKILAAPIKGILKFLLHAGCGILILIVVNIIAGFFNIYIPITWGSVIVSGLAGLPGVALIILLKLLL